MLSATKTNSITYALVWDKLKTDKTSGDVTSGEEDEEDELRAEVTAALRWTPPFLAPPPKTPNHRLHIGTRASGIVGSSVSRKILRRCLNAFCSGQRERLLWGTRAGRPADSPSRCCCPAPANCRESIGASHLKSELNLLHWLSGGNRPGRFWKTSQPGPSIDITQK